MHSPIEFIDHFVLLSFDVLGIKGIFTEEFQPSTIPSIQGRLIKQVLQTIMVCPQLKPLSHAVVPSLIKIMHYVYQFQTMSGIEPFMLFQFSGLETYHKPVLTKDSS
jgi:hypothetical protein